MAMLKPLGIEKGKPFSPNARRKSILEDAAFVGESMAKANSFDKRFAGVRYRPATHWDYVMDWDATDETPFYHQLDELGAYTYEATRSILRQDLCVAGHRTTGILSLRILS